LTVSPPIINSNMIKRIYEHYLDILFVAASATFSLWLMFTTLSYNYFTQKILINFKIWSDFALTIPLIRSFSFGHNWPPQYPIYPGEPIKYHFMFFYFVGLLEKMGIPLSWALNIPSALGYFTILFMLYLLGRNLFKDKRVGALAALFLCFNGTLAFLDFFRKHPVSLNSVLNTMDFTTNSPWDTSPVLMFWHLAVYINQRHFCFALGILMTLIWLCTQHERMSPRARLLSALGIAVAIGTLPTLHEPVCVMTAITMIIYFVIFPNLRKYLVIVGGASLVVMALIFALGGRIQPNLDQVAKWYPGFAIHDKLTLWNAIAFWWYNMGLHLILVPVGFILAPRKAKLFLLPAFAIFALGFFISFSQDVFTNHKFFNFFFILAQMFSAFSIVKFWDWVRAKKWIYRDMGSYATAVVLFFLVFSGIIDFFAVKNAYMAEIPDLGASPVANWIYNNTPPDAVFLNSGLFFHPASIAGRKIFVGPHYVTGGPGYDIYKRFAEMKTMYQSQDPKIFCPIMHSNNISYISVQDTSHDTLLNMVIPVEYFKNNFQADFTSPDADGMLIYSVKRLCGS
jgi:hypothetical protein